jgi:hypothetical protein
MKNLSFDKKAKAYKSLKSKINALKSRVKKRLELNKLKDGVDSDKLKWEKLAEIIAKSAAEADCTSEMAIVLQAET